MYETGETRVSWERKNRILTLEGEPVLSYTLSWPKIEDGGLGGRWISKYYARLARSWRRRWEREVYWRACLELAARREEARPFTPWSGELTGETALLQDGVLSLRFFGAEVRGDGRPARVRWGDVWKLREGAPKSLGSLFQGEKGWKKRLWQVILRQGEEGTAFWTATGLKRPKKPVSFGTGVSPRRGWRWPCPSAPFPPQRRAAQCLP